MSTSFLVHGVPAPQGSKKAYVRGGRAVLVESSAKVKPWREAVKSVAVDEMRGQAPIEGAVQVVIDFYLPRPKSLPKRVVLPTKRPDIDKLVRSTLDALTDAGVFRDDSQVVELRVSKRYTGTEMATPGAFITVLWLDGGQ